MSTLLNYALTSDSLPLQASPASGNLDSRTLILVISNPNPSTPVTLQGLSISFPIGTDATDLTDSGDVSGIQIVIPTTWQHDDPDISGTRAKYVFHPRNQEFQVKGQTLTFYFNNVEPNRRPGTVTIEVVEGIGDCTPPSGTPQPTDCQTQDLTITKFPNGWGEVTFSAEPDQIPLGGSTILQWAGPDGANYSLEYYDVKKDAIVTVGPLLSVGHYPADTAPPLILPRTTTFTLLVSETIEHKSYEAQAQKTVTVDIPRQLNIDKFECSAADFSPLGFTLRWQVQVADSCTLSVDGLSGSVPVDFVDDLLGTGNSCQVRSDDGITLIFSKDDGSGTELGRIKLPTPVPESITFILKAAKDSEHVEQRFTGNLLRPQLNGFYGTVRYDAGDFGDFDPYTYSVSWDTANAHVSIQATNATLLSGTDYSSDYDHADFTILCSGFGESQSRTITVQYRKF